MLKNISPFLPALLISSALLPATAATAFADNKIALTAISAFEKICTQRGQRLFRVMNRMERFAKEAGYDTLPFEVEFYDTTLESARIPVVQGTNRKCLVRFDGDHTRAATKAVLAFVERANFGRETRIPRTHREAQLPGTILFTARLLQSGSKAVLHVGTTQGPTGVQTFINVERLPV